MGSKLRRRQPGASVPDLSSVIQPQAASSHKRFGSFRRASQWVLSKTKAPKSLSSGDSSTSSSATSTPSSSLSSFNPSSKALSNELATTSSISQPLSTPKIWHSTASAAIAVVSNSSQLDLQQIQKEPKFASKTGREAYLAVPKDHKFARESVDFCQSFTYWRYARLIEPELNELPKAAKLAVQQEESSSYPDIDATVDIPTELLSQPEHTDSSSEEHSFYTPLEKPSPLIVSPEHPVDSDDMHMLMGFSSYLSLQPPLRPFPVFGNNPIEFLSDYGLYIPKIEGQSCRTSLPLPLETIITTTCWNISPKYKRYGVLLQNGLEPIQLPPWV